MNRHRHAMQLIAEARPAVLDDAPDRPVPSFPDRPTPARPAPRIGRRLLLAGLVPTAAAAVAGVAVLVSATNPPAGPAPTASPQAPTARGILLAAAGKTTTAPPTGKYWVTRVELHHVYDVGGYHVLGRTEVETWHPLRPGGDVTSVSRSLGAVPATDADKAAWQAVGSPATWNRAGNRALSTAPGRRDVSVYPDGGFTIGGTPLTYAQIRALPTDPEKLKAYLIGLDMAAGHDGKWTAEELARWHVEMIFTESWELLTALPVSPAVRAATYRMLADQPGLTTDGTVRDGKGRAGAGISYAYRVADSATAEPRLVGTRLIIDPDSGALLAHEQKPEAWLYLDARFSDATPPRS
jgi:hypothetical protein